MCELKKVLSNAQHAELDEQLTTISKMSSGMIERYQDPGSVSDEEEPYAE